MLYLHLNIHKRLSDDRRADPLQYLCIILTIYLICDMMIGVTMNYKDGFDE